MKVVKASGVLCYMAFLAYMSLGTSYPRPVEGMFSAYGTRFFHIIGYWLLTLLVAWLRPSRCRDRAWFAAGIAFAYGAILELLQLFVPGRAFSLGDILANLCGVLGGALCLSCAMAAANAKRVRSP